MSRNRHGLVHPFKQTLHQFLADLSSLNDHGLTDAQCLMVQDVFKAIIDVLEKAADTSFLRADLLQHVREFYGIYYSWNNPPVTEDPRKHRISETMRLKKMRKGMLARYAWGPLFATDDEIRAFAGIYQRFLSLEHLANAQEAFFAGTVRLAKRKAISSARLAKRKTA
jgi:hypothetical protein